MTRPATRKADTPTTDVELPDDTPPSGDREEGAKENPEYGPAMVGHHQMRVLMSLFKRHGMTTDTAQYDWLTLRLGRELSSRKDITAVEAGHLLHDLDTIPVPEPGSLARALIAVQAELPFVAKNRKAVVPTKAGGQYSYTYADLADVTEAALPLLTKHGLAFSCCPRAGDKGYELVGYLMHESGETREGALPLYGNDAQALGGSLTYHRRYLLGCMIGLVTDDDADARQAMGATHTQGQATPYEPPARVLGPDDWAQDPTANDLTAQLLTDLDTLAGHAGTTREGITARWRHAHDDITVDQLADLAPMTLAPLVDSIRDYLAKQGAKA